MKKMLLFAALFAFSLVSIGQVQKVLKKSTAPINKVKERIAISEKDLGNVHVNSNGVFTRPVVSQKSITSDLEIIDLHSSRNVFSVLGSDQTCIYYNPDINAVVYTARGNNLPGTGVTTVGTGNDICTSVSVDGGATFTSGITLGPINGFNNRYPSGVVYNPAGNTDPANAFYAVAAPLTGGSGWMGQQFGSNSWDNTNPIGTFFAPTNSPSGVSGAASILGLYVDNMGFAHAVAITYNSGLTDYRISLIKGTFDAANGQYTWERNELVDFPGVISPSDQSTNVTTVSSIGFSPDGSVGYAVIIGSDNRAPEGDYSSMQPIIYKSTNNGTTWELMDYLDLKNHPDFLSYSGIRPLRREFYVGGTVKPFFSDCDVTVDLNGDVHIFSLVQGGYSDDIDSLGYTYGTEVGGIYEVYNSSQGNDFFIRTVDTTMQTYDVSKDESPLTSTGSDNIGWTHRVQAGCSADGKIVYVFWTDTDSLFFGEVVNLYPDIFGWAHNITEGTFTHVKRFSDVMVTGYGAEFYFNFVSPIAMLDGEGIEIPYAYSAIFHDGNTAGDNPIPHKYVKGIGWAFEDFDLGTGVGQVASVLNSLSSYPNPVATELIVNVSLSRSASLTLYMTNLVGQKVFSTDKMGLIGVNTFSVDVSNLKPGVYFYTALVEGQKSTKKIVIE